MKKSQVAVPAWLRRGPLVVLALLAAICARVSAATAVDTSTYALTAADLKLLDELERHATLFFLDHSNVRTGLTQDRAPASGRPGFGPSSVAATGFALTAWCIADSRGWLPPGEAQRRVGRTLRSRLIEGLPP